MLQPLGAKLVDLGFEGAPEGDPDGMHYNLVYDFKPANTECHLLLSNPANTYDSPMFDELEVLEAKVPKGGKRR